MAFPISTLKAIREKLVIDGSIVIEVPSANDLLLNQLYTKSFMEFTLWSQHLILHTPDSLKRFLQMAGFRQIMIRQVQRYGLSNHMTWLHKGMPGGHKHELSCIESPELVAAYQASIAAIGACDTLIATAKA